MKAENMQFSKLVQLCPKGAFKPEIFASKAKRAFFLGHPVLPLNQHQPTQFYDLNQSSTLNQASPAAQVEA